MTGPAEEHRGGIRIIDSVSGHFPSASSYDGTTFDEAYAGAAVPDTTWTHVFGEALSTTSRAASINGANRGTNGTTINPSAATGVRIGTRAAGDEFYQAAGAIAEVSIWDGTGMSDGNRASLSTKLAVGWNPININAEVGQPWTGKLTAYILDSSNSLTDLSGNGHNFTMIGTLTNFGSHPTIDAVSGGGGSEVGMFRRRGQWLW
jgi:hypothetical protein